MTGAAISIHVWSYISHTCPSARTDRYIRISPTNDEAARYEERCQGSDLALDRLGSLRHESNGRGRETGRRSGRAAPTRTSRARTGTSLSSASDSAPRPAGDGDIDWTAPWAVAAFRPSSGERVMWLK
jgi:hypothetical protein